MSETPGVPERGLTEDEYAALLPVMAAKRAEELNALFADRLPPGMEFAWVPPAAERCTCTDAGGMVEVRGGRCTYCRKPYAG